jgi:serine protease Do
MGRIGLAAINCLALLLCIAPCGGTLRPALAAGLNDAEANVLRSVLPAVVNIAARLVERSKAEDEAAGTENSRGWRTMVVSGSGFIVTHSGVIVTNWHVIQDAYQITVTFVDGSHAPAHVLSAARSVDIALIKVEVDHPLPVLHFANSDTLQIGDPVFAVGNPLGLGISVSAGIVSGLNRKVLDTPYDDFIQTDAAINHGNSGGPLLNSAGEVVGLDTALVSPTRASAGLGFAIPSDDVQFVISRLLRYGWVRPGWIGAKLQQVTPRLAEALGLPGARGSIVDHISSGGPAAQAGLQAGDIILRFGDKTPSDTRALMRDIAMTPGGTRVTLTVWRDGKEMEVPVAIETWPEATVLARDAPTPPVRPKPPPIPPDLGLTLAPLTAADRAKYGLGAEQTGVLVTGVLAGTDAAQQGVVPGDVIERVGNTPVRTPAEVRQGFAAARQAQRRFVPVLVLPKQAKHPGPTWVALRVAEG